MADTKADKELAEFFESLLTDPTERQILQLILEGTEEGVIVERLLSAPAGDEKKQTTESGDRS